MTSANNKYHPLSIVAVTAVGIFAMWLSWKYNAVRNTSDIERIKAATLSLNQAVTDLEDNFSVLEKELIEHFREHEGAD